MPLKFDSQGWLIPGSDPNIKVNTSIRTAKTYDSFTPLVGGKAAGIVWHWTANGENYSGDDRCGKSPNTCITDYMLKEVVDPTRKASWNFFLNRRGELWQHASIYTPTWTTTGSWRPVYKPVTENTGIMVTAHVNRALLAIEMENGGIVLPQVNKETKQEEWFVWPYASSINKCSGGSQCGEVEAEKAARTGSVTFEQRTKIDPKRVTKMGGKAYDTWTSAQIRTATELAKALKQQLNWVSPKQIHYSHEQFVPTTKRDPGALWMDGVLPQMEVNVFGRRADGGFAINPLNIVMAVGAAGLGYYLWKRIQAKRAAALPAPAI